MKAKSIPLLFAILLLCLPNELFAKEVYPKTVYLTFQAENGSFKQVNELDGTITIYFKTLDVINIHSILLNGSDVTTELVMNHYSLPALTKNTTLDITFEKAIINPQKSYITRSFESLTSADIEP
jgi:hypothetical protein